MSDLENIHAKLREASEHALPEKLMLAHDEVLRANNAATDVLGGATHKEALDMQAQLGIATERLAEAIDLLDDARLSIIGMEVRLCIGKAIGIGNINIFTDDPVTTAINEEVREAISRPAVPDNTLGFMLDGLDVEAVLAAEADEDEPDFEPELVYEDDISCVYKAEGGTIVKFIRPDEEGTPEEKEQLALKTLRYMVASLNVGKGVPGLEQIIASDENLKVVVCEAVSGVAIEQLEDADLEAIPDKHFDQLITTYQQMQARSLEADSSRQGRTVVYDPEQGFTVTDYDHLVVIQEGDEFYQRQRIEEKIANFLSAKGLLRNHSPSEPVPQVLIRLRDRCARRLGAYVGEAIDKRWQKDGFIS